MMSRASRRRLMYKLLWMAQCKSRDIFSIFLSITWLSALIYYLISQLIDSQKVQHDKFVHRTERQSLGSETELLTKLGFYGEGTLVQFDLNMTMPVFVTLVESDQVDVFYDFLGSFRQYYSGNRLVVYNNGIPKEDLPMIIATCQCEVKDIQWNSYPAHARNRKMRAFMPLLVQESLQKYGIVFWCSPYTKFTSSNLQPYLVKAKKHGIVSWTETQFPTSSFTHYKMFKYFHTNQSKFYFHRFAHPNMAIFVNKDDIHNKLMYPWCKCAINIDCISPLGAQVGGCNFDNKPKYLYSGCHHYEASAFNVILGKMFDMDTPYIGNENLFMINNKDR